MNIFKKIHTYMKDSHYRVMASRLMLMGFAMPPTREEWEEEHRVFLKTSKDVLKVKGE